MTVTPSHFAVSCVNVIAYGVTVGETVCQSGGTPSVTSSPEPLKSPLNRGVERRGCYGVPAGVCSQQCSPDG